MSRASVVQILGVLVLAVAAYLAWGLSPGLGVVGAGLLAFGVAAELPARTPDDGA